MRSTLIPFDPSTAQVPISSKVWGFRLYITAKSLCQTAALVVHLFHSSWVTQTPTKSDTLPVLQAILHGASWRSSHLCKHLQTLMLLCWKPTRLSLMKSSPTSSKYFARISYGKDTLGQEPKVELASCAGTDWGCKSSHSSVYPSGSTCFRFQVRLTMRSNCTWNWSTGIATLDFFENFSLKWRMRSGAVITG